MTRLKSLSLASVLLGLVAACSHETSGPDTSGAVNKSVSGQTGQAVVGGMCKAPPAPSPTPPPVAGCAEDRGSGWVAIPCICDLWLTNASSASITAGIQVTVVPDPQSPAGTLAEIAFDDPDASWYAAWKTQAADGSFSVANASGKTTVSVARSITLAPVPLAGCTTRTARTQVTSATVSMHARRDDGVEIATMALCFNSGPQ